MSPAPEPPEAEFAPTGTRAPSLWPSSTRASERASTGFASTRFDPLAEERARQQAQAAAAFDVCRPALALRAVLLVQAALAVVALSGARDLSDWAARQAALSVGGVLATVFWLVLVCALRRLLQQQGPTGRVCMVLGGGVAAAWMAWAPLAWAGLAQDSALRASGAGLAGLACAALLWAWLDLRSRIWQPADGARRMADPHPRIRPQFFLDALHTARALLRVDATRTGALLEDLTELLRVDLADIGASISLQEDIELARRYLAIEAVRFGPRLQVEWQVDPRVHAVRVPPLVLQALLENAVRHGVEPAAEGGRISVRARLNQGQVVLVVSNTLPDEAGSPGPGRALQHIRERLRQLHDVAAECDVRCEEGWFRARVVLPAP